jgi:inorganic phosphate transporter, PiT family
MIWILLLLATFFLAYTNGANDNFKGVATLFGTGTTDYKSAISWATICTFMGSLTALYVAGGLVKSFSGKGLVPDELLANPNFAISIALAAALTVFLATKIGMPISTTHALVGTLAGTGCMAAWADFNFQKLTTAFIYPLLLSPLMAALVSVCLYLIFKTVRLWLGVEKDSFLDLSIPVGRVVSTQENTTVIGYSGKVFGISAQKVLDKLHYLSAGVVSFARGLNDTPKIVGLLLIVPFLNVTYAMVGVAICIGVGGLLSAKKVGETVAKDITPMNHGQGFTANLVTGLLTATASIHGLPVSTTHVSVGSIVGIGTVNKTANYQMINKIALAWLLTLPISATIGAITFYILNLDFFAV